MAPARVVQSHNLGQSRELVHGGNRESQDIIRLRGASKPGEKDRARIAFWEKFRWQKRNFIKRYREMK